MSPREIVRLARNLQGQSEAAVERSLQEQRLSPEDRISVKHMLAAAATQRHIDAMGLATNGAEYGMNQKPTNEVQRLLVRAGFRLGQRYGASDVDRLLQDSKLDVTERLACRMELSELDMTAETRETPHQLQASGEHARGKLLTDRRGEPIVIRAIAE